jgi:hypothetical protein
MFFPLAAALRKAGGGNYKDAMGGLNLLLMVGETVQSQDANRPPTTDLSVANSLLQLAGVCA